MIMKRDIRGERHHSPLPFLLSPEGNYKIKPEPLSHLATILTFHSIKRCWMSRRNVDPRKGTPPYALINVK